MKRVVIYIRVSTQEQAQEGYSIQAQKDKLTAYCIARDWIIHEIYVDGGFSGSNIDRPGIQQLIQDVKNSLIDIVLVYKLDRLSRSQKDTLYLIEDIFLKNNADLVSMQESFDTSSPFGRAMVGMLSVFAQLERESIRERSMMGQRERAKEGLHHGSRMSPIGYEYEGDSMVVNEYEAAQVRMIYTLYLEGKSMGSIAKYMREAGFRHKYSNYANTRTIANILSRAVYAGKIKHRNEYFSGQHDAIVSEDTWNHVQQMLKNMRDNQVKRSPSNDTLLKDILYCSHCGSKFARRVSGKNLYYECYSRYGHPSYMVKDPNCKNLIWKVPNLDAVVEKQILSLASDRAELEKYLQKRKGGKQNNNKALKDKLIRIDKQIEKLMLLYQDDKMPVSEISSRIQSLYSEKLSLEEMLLVNNKDHPVIDALDISDLLENIFSTWSTSTIEEKRTMVHPLISRVWVDWDTVNIEWIF
jgi:site-specific DNA recombinase